MSGVVIVRRAPPLPRSENRIPAHTLLPHWIEEAIPRD
jgi:hypothetical protein